MTFVTYRRLWPGWEWFIWREDPAEQMPPLLLGSGFVLRRRNVMRAATVPDPRKAAST